MSKVEKIISKTAEMMLKTCPVERNGHTLTSMFRIDGHTFTMNDIDYSDVMTCMSYRCIDVRIDQVGFLPVRATFQPVGNRISDEHKRSECIYWLAEQLVRKVLPEVDVKWKIMIHNDQVEEALSVL